MRTIILLFCALFLLSAKVQADNERLIHVRTSLPVPADHRAHAVITDNLNLVVLDMVIVGSVVDIAFRFVASDLNGSGRVDFDDFYVFVEAFGLPGPARANLDRAGRVDFDDLFLFADQFGLDMASPGTAKMAWSERQQFAADLEKNAALFGANLADPAVQAEIARLRTKLTGERYNGVIAAGYNISRDDVRLYNILGQRLDASRLPTTSGVYFAQFAGAPAVRFNVHDGRAAVHGSPVYNWGELAQYAQPRAIRAAAKTAAFEFSFTFSLVSESNAFVAVSFPLVAASVPFGETPVFEAPSITELSGGIVYLVPPDITPPALTLSVDGTAVHYGISEGESLPVSYTLTVGDSSSSGVSNDAVLSGTGEYDLPPGRYVILLAAADSLGNTAELRDSLIVLPPVVVTHELLIIGPSEIGHAEEFEVSAVFATYEDGVETTREAVTPDEGNEVPGGLPLGNQTLEFHYAGAAGSLTVNVVDRPPAVRIQLTRYQFATAEGRGMDVRLDVSDDFPVSGAAPILATSNNGRQAALDITLSGGYGGGVVQIPSATGMAASTWTLTGSYTDAAGQTGTASLEFGQAGLTAEPTPTPSVSQPATGGGGGGGTPPPPLTAPSYGSATFNGVAPGGNLNISLGESITVSFNSVGGNPSPASELQYSFDGVNFQSASGNSYTSPAPGILYVRGRLSNSQGSVNTATLNVTVVGGAP